MKKVLVTGVTGQVGHEVSRLLRKEFSVKAAGRKDAGDVEIDLSRPETIADAIERVQPDYIVNCAAYTQVDRAESDRDMAYLINSEAPCELAKSAVKLGIPLIHFSTDYVFDGSGEKPHVEAETTGPLNVYGESKLAGERAIIASGCNYVILRTSWVFSDRGANFVKTMLRLGRERKELGVVADQFGAPTSALALANSVKAVVNCLESRPSADIAGVYHCACEGETTWHGFAQEIFRLAKACGMPISIENVAPLPTDAYPTPAKRPRNSRLNCDKFAATFDFRMPDWREALAEVVMSLASNHAESK